MGAQPKAQTRARISTLGFSLPRIPIEQVVNEAAEKALIACVFHQPDLLATLDEIIQPQDFYTLFHGFIWHAFQQLAGRNIGIDLVTVSDELEKNRMLNLEELVALTTAAPDIKNAEHYARIVRDISIKVRILKAFTEGISFIIDNPAESTERVTDEANRLLFEASEQRSETPSSLVAIASSEMERVEDIIHGVVPDGISTGFSHTDKLLHVFGPGELVILAGSEGMGKTTMLLSKIRNLLKLGKRVLLFTLEMSKADIVRILAAMEGGIPKDSLKTGQLNQSEWGRYVKAMGDVSQWPLYIIDEYPALTPLQLRRRLRKLTVMEGGHFDLVVSDGLWLMEPTEPQENRTRAVFTITRDLIEIGRDFNLPIFLTHQYNGEARSRHDKTPVLFDLAESAAVRRNAPIILGLYREVYYGGAPVRDITQEYILKDRNGTAQGRVVDYMFNRAFNRYEELPHG